MRASLVGAVFAIAVGFGLAGCLEQSARPVVPQEDPRTPTAPGKVVPAPGGTPQMDPVVVVPTAPDSGVMAQPKDAGEAPRVDAGAPDPGANAADPALEGNLQDFEGFSADGKRFAHSTYSEGAGFYLVHVIEGREGKLAQRFILESPEQLQAARKALQAGGFTSRGGALPAGVQVDAKVEGGKVVVTQKSEGGTRTLYEGNPFDQGAPVSAKVARVSPDGERVAVKVEQEAITEFGGITTYLLLEVAR